MGWILRLVESGTDSLARSVDVLEISRPEGLVDIANFGLTLLKAKQLLARVQQAVVAAQARIMRFCGRTARLAAEDVMSKIGGRTGSRRCSAG